MNSISIEEAHDLYNKLHNENNLLEVGNSWRYWLKHRNKTKNLIEICGIELPFHKLGRKICVDKEHFLKKVQDTIKKKLEIENGPIENKGVVRGNFVELSRQDSGMIESYYVCRKCENVASTKHDKPQCHTCSDWNGCGRNCTLSHLICKNCDIVQTV